MIGTEVVSSDFDAIYIVRFEILIMLNIETPLFWDVTPWNLVFTNVSLYLLSPYSPKRWQISTLQHDVTTRGNIAGN